MASSSSKIDVPKKQKSKNKILIPENFPETPKLTVWDVDAHKLPEDGFFVICEGSRRTGKSIFLKWLLYHYKDLFDLAIVLSETPHNGFWQPIVSNQYVHNGWDPFLIEKLMEEQAKEIEKSMKEKSYKPRKVLVVLDDIVGDRRHIHEDTTLNRLAVEGRHFKIFICLTTQEPHAIGTALRNNCDIAVIFQQKSKRAKDSVCNDFLSNKLSHRLQADDLLKTYTHNHDCILVEMFNLDPSVIKGYFHVPATMTFDEKTQHVTVPDYQLGSQKQQRLAKTKTGSIPLFS
jgi:hypothetical protein